MTITLEDMENPCGGSNENSEQAGMCPNSDSSESDRTDTLLLDSQLQQLNLKKQNDQLRELLEQLETSRAMYSDLYDFAPVGYVTIDESCSVIAINLTAANLLGIDREFLLKQSFLRFITPEDLKNFQLHLQQIRETGVRRHEFEMRLQRSDGGSFWALLEANTVWKGEYRFIISDISRHKQAERELLYMHKLESLGRMSSGIAHDFNNLLQSVLGNLELALMRNDNQDRLRKHIKQAVKAAESAAKLSALMLSYSGRGHFITKPVDLNDLVGDCSTLLTTAVAGSISVSLTLAEALPPVMADAEQIEQVLMSLIVNSSEAIGEEKGSITISTGVGEFDQSTLNNSRLKEKLPPGRYVWFEVRDSGCGMDADALFKLFDPFYTTKFTGRGLGMSATHGIITAHRGAVFVESALGSGTTIRILLPIAVSSLAEVQATSGETGEVVLEAELTQPSKVVLFIDNDEELRKVTVEMLEELGFVVLATSDSEKLLENFRKQSERVSFVMLNKSIPRADGIGMIKELKSIKPDVKILLASGYSREDMTERFKGLEIDGFMKKPFSIGHLKKELQRILH